MATPPVESKRSPPLYHSPSHADQVFYLLLTTAGAMLVHQALPKSLKGKRIITLGVQLFGIYHAFGLNWSGIKHVASNTFKNFPVNWHSLSHVFTTGVK